MNNWKKVNKEEFQEFVDNYPDELTYNITTVCEPPMGNHNDFTSGLVWPKSMVTKIILNTAMIGFPSYKGELDEFYILDNKK